MTNNEVIKELIDASQEEAKYGDKENHYSDIMRRIEAFDIAVKSLEQETKGFAEVVDFFNDIMETLHKDLNCYSISTESVVYARNRVYDVFSRRYKIKEIKRNGEEQTIQEV